MVTMIRILIRAVFSSTRKYHHDASYKKKLLTSYNKNGYNEDGFGKLFAGLSNRNVAAMSRRRALCRLSVNYDGAGEYGSTGQFTQRDSTHLQ
jgi:hypothetical protein